MDTPILLNISSGVYLDHTKTGYCFVCHVAITSQQVYSQHIEGKKHTRRCVALLGPSVATGYAGESNDNAGEGFDNAGESSNNAGEGFDNAGEGSDNAGEASVLSPECQPGCLDCWVVLRGLRKGREYLSIKHSGVQHNMSQSVELKEAAKNRSMTKTVHPEALVTTGNGCGFSAEETRVKTGVESRSSVQAGSPAVSTEQTWQDCTSPGQFHPGPHLKRTAPVVPLSLALMSPTPAIAVKENNLSCPSSGQAQGDGCAFLPQTTHNEGELKGLGEMTSALNLTQPALNIPHPTSPDGKNDGSSSRACHRQGLINTAAATPPPPELDDDKRCDICNMGFSGPQNAQDHYRSEAHKQKKHIAELVRSGALSRDPDTGALKGKVGAADADQYICGLCLVATNSLVSYFEHINSKAHKKNKID